MNTFMQILWLILGSIGLTILAIFIVIASILGLRYSNRLSYLKSIGFNYKEKPRPMKKYMPYDRCKYYYKPKTNQWIKRKDLIIMDWVSIYLIYGIELKECGPFPYWKV